MIVTMTAADGGGATVGTTTIMVGTAVGGGITATIAMTGAGTVTVTGVSTGIAIATGADTAQLSLLPRTLAVGENRFPSMLGTKPLDEMSIRLALANRIMAAADYGEREPCRLSTLSRADHPGTRCNVAAFILGHSKSERPMPSPTNISRAKSGSNRNKTSFQGSSREEPKDRSFAPDRKGESSAGATGKDRKRSVAADRQNGSR